MTDYTLGNDDDLLKKKTAEDSSEAVSQQEIPESLDKEAFNLWSKGKPKEAIKRAVDHLNTIECEKKPKALFMQLAYYLFFVNDFPSASQLFFEAHKHYPDDGEIITNLAIALSRSGDYKQSIDFMKKTL